MGAVYIGTSGFSYAEWKGKFYPEDLPQRDWLSYYAERFDTVEINASFYATIGKAQYKRWTNASMTRPVKIFGLLLKVIAISRR